MKHTRKAHRLLMSLLDLYIEAQQDCISYEETRKSEDANNAIEMIADSQVFRYFLDAHDANQKLKQLDSRETLK